MTKPIVYVSVSGGIADAQSYGEPETEIILIDWDNYDDNLPDVDMVVLEHISRAKDLEEAYPAIWDDLFYALERAAGEDLEQYDDQDTAIIMHALEEAGHPWKLSEARQLPLDILG